MLKINTQVKIALCAAFLLSSASVWAVEAPLRIPPKVVPHPVARPEVKSVTPSPFTERQRYTNSANNTGISSNGCTAADGVSDTC